MIFANYFEKYVRKVIVTERRLFSSLGILIRGNLWMNATKSWSKLLQSMTCREIIEDNLQIWTISGRFILCSPFCGECLVSFIWISSRMRHWPLLRMSQTCRNRRKHCSLVLRKWWTRWLQIKSTRKQELLGTSINSISRQSVNYQFRPPDKARRP